MKNSKLKDIEMKFKIELLIRSMIKSSSCKESLMNFRQDKKKSKGNSIMQMIYLKKKERLMNRINYETLS